MPDSRSERRAQPVNYFEVYDRTDGRFMGKLYDINTGGLRLSSENEFRPYVLYHFRLRLPQPIRGEREVEFDAICKWTMEYKTHLLAGTYTAGFQISYLAFEHRELIQTMIRSPWFRDWREAPDYETIRRETDYPVV